MILSGKEIKKELNKNIFIEPFDKSKINPNSYNDYLTEYNTLKDDFAMAISFLLF